MSRERNTAEQEFLVDFLRSNNVRLKAGADDGILRTVEYGYKHGYNIAEIAYNLATSGHETAYWYQPIREGATRSGPNFTDEQARAAVRSAMNKGIIRVDYVTAINGRSYYGRGLTQITWLDNYKKFEKLTGKPLVANPDLALEWDTALYIMYEGINKGHFRKHKFADFIKAGQSVKVEDFIPCRNIINGDGKKYGLTIAQAAMDWYRALKTHDTKLRAAYAPKSTGWIAMLLGLFNLFSKKGN